MMENTVKVSVSEGGGECDAALVTDLMTSKNGHNYYCPLCLVKLRLKRRCSVEVGRRDQEGSSDATWSEKLQFLFRYLGLNMNLTRSSKNRVQDPHESLKQEEDRTLCEECTSINVQFVGLYRQLEKIELEVATCLKLLQEKLSKSKSSAGHGVKIQCQRQEELDSAEEMMMENLDELRREILDKCSLKLSTLPQANNDKQFGDVEELRTEAQPCPTQTSQTGTDKLGAPPKPEHVQVVEVTAVKSKPKPLPLPAIQVRKSARQQKMKLKPSSSPCPDTIPAIGIAQSKIKSNSPGRSKPLKVKVNKKVKLISKSDRRTYSAPLELASPNSMKEPESESPKYSFNLKTGHHICDLCSKEFKFIWNLKAHYKSLHLKVTYKCGEEGCGRVFRHRHPYYKHQRSKHIGLKVECPRCYKTFSNKFGLDKHLQMISCVAGESPKHVCSCRLCRQGFTTVRDFRLHLNDVHLQLRKFGCGQCPMKFKRSGHLKQHRNSVHLGIKRGH